MKKTHIFLLLFLLFGSNSLRAQSSPASPSAAASAVRQIVLGNATVPLDGLWKFHIGDNMAWAQPGFDDSAWATQDLTPPPGSYDPGYGTSVFVPGWTAQGYKGYSGYAWYRLRVNIQSGQTALALKMPDEFDDAYQVYVNGQRIGEFGRFIAHGVTFYGSQPRAFPLPANLRSGRATIAVRMWMSPGTPLNTPDAGGLHGPPVLGQASVIAAQTRLDWESVDRVEYSVFAEMAVVLLALAVAFALFRLDRSERAYLWLGLVCAVILTGGVCRILGYYTTWIGGDLLRLFFDAFFFPVSLGLWVVFWAAWFRLEGRARLHRMVWGVVGLLGLGMTMLRAPLYGSVVPVHAIVWLSPLTLILKLLLGALLVGVAVRGIRRDKTEGWLALPAVVLVFLSQYQEQLGVLHVPVLFFPFGLGIHLEQIATMLSLLIITVLLLRRFLHAQREREQWRLEIEQAREVQQMLIPVTPPDTPGFAVESVYLPAQKVGGDFFHIRPSDDGSLLIVVGDVSGKGLKAAMTVSTIVGALRDYPAREPAEILAHLNRVLHGQIAGFVTCCAVFIAPDGKLTIANAGHLSPYRNGEEMPVTGGLPLGILAEDSYEETHYQLAPGDRLTFMSDGVVEATNERKELFGFERTQAISTQPAAAIATAAKNFGQEDDISVLSVTRNANMKAAIA